MFDISHRVFHVYHFFSLSLILLSMYNEWGRGGMHIEYWWESRKKGDQWEDQDVGGRTLLKWIFEKYDRIVWIGLIWLRIGTSGRLL
jgi:hypothetical protein